jgi:uncharacterized membrane protein
MSLATIYLTVLRLLHIFGAVIWVGGGIFVVTVVAPTVAAAGPDGAKFMQWLGRVGRMSRTFAAASGTTVLTGLLLYWPISGHLNGAWLASPRGLTLSIGSVLGLLAFVHSMVVTNRLSAQSAALAKEMAARSGPPAPEQILAAQQLGAKASSAAAQTVALAALALLGMAAAQTMPATF